jgi:hypothetical protein
LDPQIQLMTEIRDRWGSEISKACQTSSVPAAFLASLIAEESGGNPNAKRFEPGVLHALWEVFVGRKKAFGSIDGVNLLVYALPAIADPTKPDAGTSSLEALRSLFTSSLERVDNLATSWGLTQVMGYHVLENWPEINHTEDLLTPANELPLSLRLLAQFADRFGLDLRKDFGELFTCWNTGEPNGKTADPQYVPRGLARMAIYSQLPPAGS